jgi:peptidoglycan/xylan/chitin deacetylase (PgdA/CDA1 family)
MLSRLMPVAAALLLAALPAHAQAPCPGNPNALGIARTVEIDTTGGPGFGFEQYKAHDFLAQKEVVLTFDDGPWPGHTRAVLETLRAHCLRATFFIIGKHALWHPDILKEVAAQGHTVGTHTWSHANLGKTKGEKATEEIEKGLSAVKLALGAPPAPFFRFPFLQDPPDQLAYLGKRNIAIFSHDVDSFDFKFRKPEQVVKSVLDKLEKKGKGIVLLHDFQQTTAKALPDLLNELKTRGYKIVHMRPKSQATTLAEWDDAARKEVKGPSGGDRPTSSVVTTVSETPPAGTAPTAQPPKR